MITTDQINICKYCQSKNTLFENQNTNDMECVICDYVNEKILYNIKKENIDTICKGCKSKSTLVKNEHDYVIECTKCGLINEEMLDQDTLRLQLEQILAADLSLF